MLIKQHTLALIILTSITACDPVSVIMGGTAVVGGNATREKGLKGATNDTLISTQVKGKLYGFHAELHGFVGVNVQEGEVLLTGDVPEESWVQEAERLAREVEGVKNVFNHVEVNKDGISISQVAADSAITTQMKGHLLCDGDVRSLNYSIKTVNGIMYIMGIAQSEAELEKTLNYGRNIKGVEKVVCYAKVKSTDPTDLENKTDLAPQEQVEQNIDEASIQPN